MSLVSCSGLLLCLLGLYCASCRILPLNMLWTNKAVSPCAVHARPNAEAYRSAALPREVLKWLNQTSGVCHYKFSEQWAACGSVWKDLHVCSSETEDTNVDCKQCEWIHKLKPLSVLKLNFKLSKFPVSCWLCQILVWLVFIVAILKSVLQENDFWSLTIISFYILLNFMWARL